MSLRTARPSGILASPALPAGIVDAALVGALNQGQGEPWAKDHWSYSQVGPWSAGETSEAPTDANNAILLGDVDPPPTEYTAGREPGHLWPWQLPVAQVNAAAGGTWPSNLERQGLNHYRRGAFLDADTMGGAQQLEWRLHGSHSSPGGTGGAPRRFLFVLAPNIPTDGIAAGFDATKDVGFETATTALAGIDGALWEMSLRVTSLGFTPNSSSPPDGGGTYRLRYRWQFWMGPSGGAYVLDEDVTKELVIDASVVNFVFAPVMWSLRFATGVAADDHSDTTLAGSQGAGDSVLTAYRAQFSWWGGGI